MDSITTFFRSTLATMWTKLMKLAKDKIPKEGEDCKLEDGYEAPLVNDFVHQFSTLSSASRSSVLMNHYD